MTPTIPPVEPHSIHIEGERGRRIRADVKTDAFSRGNARPRTVTFDPRATVFRGWINPGIAQQPIASAGTLILLLDGVGRSWSETRFGQATLLCSVKQGLGQGRERTQANGPFEEIATAEMRAVCA